MSWSRSQNSGQVHSASSAVVRTTMLALRLPAPQAPASPLRIQVVSFSDPKLAVRTASREKQAFRIQSRKNGIPLGESGRQAPSQLPRSALSSVLLGRLRIAGHVRILELLCFLQRLAGLRLGLAQTFARRLLSSPRFLGGGTPRFPRGGLRHD